MVKVVSDGPGLTIMVFSPRFRLETSMARFCGVVCTYRGSVYFVVVRCLENSTVLVLVLHAE